MVFLHHSYHTFGAVISFSTKQRVSSANIVGMTNTAGLQPPARRDTIQRSGSSRWIGNDPWKRYRIRQWKSPLLLLTYFVIGLGTSIGHCVFYPLLDGVIVADSSNQERNIRRAAALFPGSHRICRMEGNSFHDSQLTDHFRSIDSALLLHS